MRTIKFRGQKQSNNVWVYGSLVVSDDLNAAIYFQVGKGEVKQMEWVYVRPETVGQFTGLHDKNGKEIYEGDIVMYYKIVTNCINPDCDPFNYIYECHVKRVEGVVEYDNGAFFVGDDCPLFYAGFDDLEELRETLNVEEENDYYDYNGTKIDENVLGIEVIGNIFDMNEPQKI